MKKSNSYVMLRDINTPEEEKIKLIREHKDELTKSDWDNISHWDLSEDFIREFQDNVDWDGISITKKLSENFIREFQDKVNWKYVSLKQKLSEDFIREFADKVDWTVISEKQELSEDFIREFSDKVDWMEISCNQKLSEDFIYEFQDEVDWENIFRYQCDRLSYEFYKRIEIREE